MLLYIRQCTFCVKTTCLLAKTHQLCLNYTRGSHHLLSEWITKATNCEVLNRDVVESYCTLDQVSNYEQVCLPCHLCLWSAIYVNCKHNFRLKNAEKCLYHFGRDSVETRVMRMQKAREHNSTELHVGQFTISGWWDFRAASVITLTFQTSRSLFFISMFQAQEMYSSIKHQMKIDPTLEDNPESRIKMNMHYCRHVIRCERHLFLLTVNAGILEKAFNNICYLMCIRFLAIGNLFSSSVIILLIKSGFLVDFILWLIVPIH